jgi:hypothetical protein
LRRTTLLLALTMRRLLWIEADGSAVGAGGMGAASSAGAAVEVAPPAPQPQADSQALHEPHELQLFLQQLLQRWWWQRFLQQLPQLPQAGAAQPQAGAAAAQPQEGASAGAAQLGAAHDGAPQVLHELQQPNTQL